MFNARNRVLLYNVYIMEEIVENPSLFKTFLNYVVKIIYLIHQYIMSINDNMGMGFSDKKLHFLVIGLAGVFLLMIIYPLFKWLESKGKTIITSWIYVFTVLVAISLFIEIGQEMTGTGDMDFADIMAGLFGFVAISIFAIVGVKVWKFIKGLIDGRITITVKDDNKE